MTNPTKGKECCPKCEKHVRDRSFIGGGSSRRSMTGVHVECKNPSCECHRKKECQEQTAVGEWCRRHCIYPQGDTREKIRTEICPCPCHGKKEVFGMPVVEDKSLAPGEWRMEEGKIRSHSPDETPSGMEEWEKEFDDKFKCEGEDCQNTDGSIHYGWNDDSGVELKAFIRNLLSSERERIAKEVEKLKGGACSSGMCGHTNLDLNSVNHGVYLGGDIALSDAAHIIRKE